MDGKKRIETNKQNVVVNNRFDSVLVVVEVYDFFVFYQINFFSRSQIGHLLFFYGVKSFLTTMPATHFSGGRWDSRVKHKAPGLNGAARPNSPVSFWERLGDKDDCRRNNMLTFFIQTK